MDTDKPTPWRLAHWKTELSTFEARHLPNGDVEVRKGPDDAPEICPPAYWRAEGCDDPTCQYIQEPLRFTVSDD